MFTVAIIGRPNVGKSTLFNRLTRTKHALVDDTPGVTRDRREGVAELGDLKFRVFDTAGLEEAEEGTLSARMTQQTLRALKDADVALLVVDGRAGIHPLDGHFGSLVRKSGTPCVLVVNKAEGRYAEGALLEAHALGLGEPVAISAEHGEGLADLYQALAPFMESVMSDECLASEENEAQGTHHTPLSIAIVGRPNVGKSTLVNKLLGEERVLTGPEAGITRDAIAVPFEWKGKKLTLVDTAGLRKRARVEEKLEKMSVTDTKRAIQYAQVVVMVMDAEQALEKQDLQIVDMVEREGRALILAVNKWDLLPKESHEEYLQVTKNRLEKVLPQVKGVPVVTISAEKGQGIPGLMKAVFEIYDTWNIRIPTAQLNRWLEHALERHMPPLVDGRRLKIRYMTQAKSRPPTFMLASNLSELPDAYARYLVGGLRDAFKLHGVPVRLKVKKGKNPYGDKGVDN